MSGISQATMGLDEKKKDQQAQAPGPMASTGVTTPGNVPSQARTAQFSSGLPQTPGSGRFTNLQSYIQANKPQGEQLGQKVASQVQTGLTKAEKEATSQAGQIAQNIQAEKARIGEAGKFAGQVETDPTQIAADKAAQQRFQQITAGQTSADDLRRQAEASQAQANLAYQGVGSQIAGLGTEAGRFNLLKQAIRQPGYSTGQQRLDQLLLQTANPQALAQQQQALSQSLGQKQKEIASTYGGPTGGILGEFAGENALASQAQKAQQNLTKALTGATTSFEEAQAKEAAGLSTKAADTNRAMDQFFTQGYNTLTPEQKAIIDPMLASGDLTPGMRTYNVLKDPNAYKQYETLGRTDLTSKDVINADELKRIQALQQLSGITPEQYTYTQTGDIGPTAGIKGQDLVNAIQNAREQFVSGLNRQISSTGSGEAQNKYGNQFATVNAAMQANLANLLKQYEAGNTNVQALTDFDRTYSGQLRTSGPTGYGGYGGSPSREDFANDPNMLANEAVRNALAQATSVSQQDLIKQFLDTLTAGGYEQGLGGIAPGTNPEATNTFNVK